MVSTKETQQEVGEMQEPKLHINGFFYTDIYIYLCACMSILIMDTHTHTKPFIIYKC